MSTKSIHVPRRKLQHAKFLVITILLLGLVTEFASADRWINASGGSWNFGGNWQDGTVPTISDDVLFDLPGIYFVSLNSDTPVLGDLQFADGGVILEMDGHEIRVSDLSLSGDAGISLLEGQVTLTGGNDVRLSDNAGDVTSLGVADVLFYFEATGSNTFSVGYDGMATLDVQDGSEASFDIMHVGARNGIGIVRVRDDATFDVEHNLMIGRFGTGEFRVQSGAIVDVRQAPIGASPPLPSGVGMEGVSATGSLLVDGTGSQFRYTPASSAPFYVGRLGAGEMTVSDGGLAQTEDTELAFNGTASADVTVTGVNSRWETAGLNISRFAGGDALVNVTAGGQLASDRLSIGTRGELVITDATSSWTSAQTITARGLLELLNGASGVIQGGIQLLGELRVEGIGTLLDSQGLPGFSTDTDGDGLTTSGIDGILRVADGARLESISGTLGGGTEAVITGANTVWQVTPRGVAVGGSRLFDSVLDITAGASLLNSSSFDNSRLEVRERGIVNVQNATMGLEEIDLLTDGTMNASDTTLDATLTGETGSVFRVMNGATTLGVVDSPHSIHTFGTVDVGTSSLTLRDGNRAELFGTTTIAGGLILASNGIALGESGELSGTGQVDATILAGADSKISAVGGNLTVGDANSFLGFRTTGELSTEAQTLTLHSASFAKLGGVTSLSGGTLQSANGVAIAPGSTIVGNGNVAAKVAAGFGSLIIAEGGDLTAGDDTALDGFFSDGELRTGPNTVTLNDLDKVVLGSLTVLGDGASGGTLAAGTANPNNVIFAIPDLLLEEGKNLIGRGSVIGNFKNNGLVSGDGDQAGERIVFEDPWVVSGKGVFENTLVLGTFSPGESPGISEGTNQAFNGVVEIELGGPTPGNGPGHHDQVRDHGQLWLMEDSSVVVTPYEEYLPLYGDLFEVLTWEEGLIGEVERIEVDPWFTERGIGFEAVWNNSDGFGSLQLRATAVPEPLASANLFCLTVWLAYFSTCRRLRK